MLNKEKEYTVIPEMGTERMAATQILICYILIAEKLGRRAILTPLYPFGRNYFLIKSRTESKCETSFSFEDQIYAI